MMGRCPPVVTSRSRNCLNDLETVQLRHVNVEEQQVETPLFPRGVSTSVRCSPAGRDVPAGRGNCSRTWALNSLSSGHEKVQRGSCSGVATGLLGWAWVGARAGRCPETEAHHSVDRVEQLVLLDRFEQLGVDAKFAKSGWVAWPFPRKSAG